MEITVDLDEEVLEAVEEIAANRCTTPGRVLSDLVRKAFEPNEEVSEIVPGVPTLPRRAPGSRLLTMTFVNRLRDDDP